MASRRFGKLSVSENKWKILLTVRSPIIWMKIVFDSSPSEKFLTQYIIIVTRQDVCPSLNGSFTFRKGYRLDQQFSRISRER